MTIIGAAWQKFTENGKTYISIKVDDEILPLTLKENKTLTLWEIPESERNGNEKMPHYRLKISNLVKRNDN